MFVPERWFLVPRNSLCVSFRPSTSTTEQEQRPISSQGAVSSTSAPPGQPAGGSTVHYYWGVPFCPRGLDPDSYTKVTTKCPAESARHLVFTFPSDYVSSCPPASRLSGDPGSDGRVREESEAGSEVSAEEGWVGGGHPAAAGGMMTTFPTGAASLTVLFMEFHNVHPPFFFPEITVSWAACWITSGDVSSKVKPAWTLPARCL